MSDEGRTAPALVSTSSRKSMACPGATERAGSSSSPPVHCGHSLQWQWPSVAAGAGRRPPRETTMLLPPHSHALTRPASATLRALTSPPGPAASPLPQRCPQPAAAPPPTTHQPLPTRAPPQRAPRRVPGARRLPPAGAAAQGTQRNTRRRSAWRWRPAQTRARARARAGGGCPCERREHPPCSRRRRRRGGRGPAAGGRRSPARGEISAIFISSLIPILQFQRK